jgi:3D (Asp-Asp-Asp) domain-containing protein
VLGQAHPARRRPWVGVASVVALLAAVTVGGAIAAHGTGTLRARDEAIIAKSRAAVLDLYALDRRLGTTRTRLAVLDRRQASLRIEQRILARQLRAATRSMRIVQARLGAQVRLIYEQGNVEPLEVILGATSLDSALTSLDNLHASATTAKELLRALKDARRQLVRTRSTLASRAAELAAARREAAATTAALGRARTARTAYIASLARQRRLTEAQIARVVAQSRAASARTAKLMRTHSAPAFPVGAAPAGPMTSLTVSATAYSTHGSTASGLPTGYGVVAVDPSLIPLGTHMSVPGYGSAVAADVGTAIVGPRIDLWFPTLAQARAWGRRTVTITFRQG